LLLVVVRVRRAGLVGGVFEGVVGGDIAVVDDDVAPELKQWARSEDGGVAVVKLVGRHQHEHAASESWQSPLAAIAGYVEVPRRRFAMMEMATALAPSRNPTRPTK